MAGERAGHTLQATALVTRPTCACCRTRTEREWYSRAHFFGAAAEAMRRILVESTRRKLSLNGGGTRSGDVHKIDLATELPSDEISRGATTRWRHWRRSGPERRGWW